MLNVLMAVEHQMLRTDLLQQLSVRHKLCAVTYPMNDRQTGGTTFAIIIARTQNK